MRCSTRNVETFVLFSSCVEALSPCLARYSCMSLELILSSITLSNSSSSPPLQGNFYCHYFATWIYDDILLSKVLAYLNSTLISIVQKKLAKNQNEKQII